MHRLQCQIGAVKSRGSMNSIPTTSEAESVSGSAGTVTAVPSDPADRVEEKPDQTDSSPATTTVSFVVVNWNGAHHLPPCLDSIKEQNYPADCIEVVLVDNGSTDGTRELLKKEYPWVRVVQNDINKGFATGVNQGVEAAAHETVALINNDMRLDPDWTKQMLAAWSPDEGYPCVGGRIHDWDGNTIDFAGGIINFHGFGHQPGFQKKVDEVAPSNLAEIPFACGGAMVVSRDIFLAAGGFDEGFFAYFEDVDFGWRLRVLGHRTRYADKALSFHRHHGTSGGAPIHEKWLLLERNALRSMLKNLGDEALGKLLGPALLLLGFRARQNSQSPRADFDLGRSLPDHENVPRPAISGLHAIGDVVQNIDEIFKLRNEIQIARRMPDAEVLNGFGRPFMPLGNSEDEEYVYVFHRLVENFGLDEVYPKTTANRVVVLAYEQIKKKMAGPAARSWEIAHALSRFADVTMVHAGEFERESDRVELVQTATHAEMQQVVSEADVVLAFGHSLVKYPWLKNIPAVLVIDLYDPWLFELLEQQRASGTAGDSDNSVARRETDIQLDLIDAGDMFLCASERQRDYWMGMLTARGRIDHSTYGADENLRMLVDVLPYGCPSEPPVPAADESSPMALKGVHPSIAEDDILVLWSGGVWEWFDPLTLVDAFAQAHKVEPRLKLYFMGLELDDATNVPKMKMVKKLRERVKASGLQDSAILFGSWVPYDERGQVLAEADVAVISARPVAESRLAFRSRMLDHFWCSVPTITTGGDILADEMTAEGAGLVVPPGDAQAMRDALLTIARDEEGRRKMAEAAGRLADRYRWNKVVESVRPVVEQPWRWRSMRAARPRQVHLTEDARHLIRMQRIELARYRSGAKKSQTPLGERTVKAVKHSKLVEKLGLFSALKKVRRSGLGQRIFGYIPEGY